MALEGLIQPAHVARALSKRTNTRTLARRKHRDAIESLDTALFARQRARSQTHTAIKHNAFAAHAITLRAQRGDELKHSNVCVCVFSALANTAHTTMPRAIKCNLDPITCALSEI